MEKSNQEEFNKLKKKYSLEIEISEDGDTHGLSIVQKGNIESFAVMVFTTVLETLNKLKNGEFVEDALLEPYDVFSTITKTTFAAMAEFSKDSSFIDKTMEEVEDHAKVFAKLYSQLYEN